MDILIKHLKEENPGIDVLKDRWCIGFISGADVMYDLMLNIFDNLAKGE